MSEDRIRFLYRSWQGYRWMFSGRKVKLDDNDIPIIKVPKLDAGKHRFLTAMMSKSLRGFHHDLFPLYFVSIGIWKLGNIPSPFSDFGPRQVEEYKECCRSLIRQLANLKTEWLEVREMTFNFVSLVDAVIESRVTVPAAVMYIKKHQMTKLDFGVEGDLRFEVMAKILEICYSLEVENKFFSRNHQMSVKIINSINEMELADERR